MGVIIPSIEVAPDTEVSCLDAPWQADAGGEGQLSAEATVHFVLEKGHHLHPVGEQVNHLWATGEIPSG